VKIEDGEQEAIMSALHKLSSVASVEQLNGAPHHFEIQSKKEASSPREIFKLCVEKGWVITEMTPIETKLEDIFRNLTTN
jgi:ABC-2 type transport system ATP-binding protein